MTQDIPTRSIAQLPLASTVSTVDTTVISQSGITKTASVGQIRGANSAVSILSDFWVGRDLYVGRDAYVSGKSFTGNLRVTSALSSATGNFTGAVKIDGAVSIGGELHVSHIGSVSTMVVYSQTSEGSAKPTSPGNIRVLQATANVTGSNGLEWLSSGGANGYGFNLKCIDNGSGITQMAFAKRHNASAWSLAGYYDDVGNFVWSSGAALATNATNGFLYIPSCSGVPSGIPTVRTGAVPIVMDIVGSKLYAYRAGAWSSVSLA